MGIGCWGALNAEVLGHWGGRVLACWGDGMLGGYWDIRATVRWGACALFLPGAMPLIGNLLLWKARKAQVGALWLNSVIKANDLGHPAHQSNDPGISSARTSKG